MTKKMIQRLAGLPSPESNFHPIPNDWIDIIAQMTTLAEVKVVNYLLRHTWGFQERDLPLHLTVDEFVNGRAVGQEKAKVKGWPFREGKYRMDLGTQLSDKSVRSGLQEAIKRGLVIEYVNDRDKARIDKYYLLLIKGKNVFVSYKGARLTERCVETLMSLGYQENAQGYFEYVFKIEKTDSEKHSPQNVGEEDFIPQDIVGGGENFLPNTLGEKKLHPQDVVGGGKILPPRGEDFSPRSVKDNYININNKTTTTKKDNLTQIDLPQKGKISEPIVVVSESNIATVWQAIVDATGKKVSREFIRRLFIHPKCQGLEYFLDVVGALAQQARKGKVQVESYLSAGIKAGYKPNHETEVIQITYNRSRGNSSCNNANEKKQRLMQSIYGGGHHGGNLV